MNIALLSARTTVSIFDTELNTDFRNWSRLPDFYTLETIPIWRELGKVAKATYSAEQFELYRCFGLKLSEWIGYCGPADFEQLADYRERRRALMWSSPRSVVVHRPRAQGKKMALRIRKQLEEAGILPSSGDSAKSLTSNHVFQVGPLAAVLCCTAVADGVRITLEFTDGDPAKAFFHHMSSHGLAYIDGYSILSTEELAAVRYEITRSMELLRNLIQGSSDDKSDGMRLK